MSKIEPRTLKGFRDYGPKEQLARQEMFRTIQNVFERFGFLPMSTPALEYKEILMSKYGDEEKLIYSFKDQGDRDVALRYDLTVPFARFVAQNQNELTYPFKRYQISPVWRAENTQKGRLREFYQCDVDIAGTVSPLADAEVVACIYTALKEVGVPRLQVKFNNRTLFFRLLGTDNPEGVPILRGLDKADKIGEDGVLAYLEEQGVSINGRANAKKILHLGKGEEALENIVRQFPEAASVASAVRGVMWYMVSCGIGPDELVFDPLTVRGLDYYTNMVFEITMPEKPEFGSIAGGGRYDGLLDTFSERSLPAVGGSIGVDRLFEALKEMGVFSDWVGAEVIVFNIDDQYESDYIRVATELRTAGVKTEIYYDTAKLDKQFKYAESKGARLAVIIGEEEKVSGNVIIKNLQTREQVVVSEKDLLAAIRSS